MMEKYDLNYLLDKIKTKDLKRIDLTYGNGISLEENDNDITLSIGTSYFSEHKDEIIRDIIEIIKKYDRSSFTIKSGLLINEDVINALCENKKIKNINLAKMDILNKYSLSLEDYNKFKSAEKELIETFCVDDELKDNYDPMIGCNASKSIYSYYSYKDFQKGIIYIDKNFDESKLYVFKYLGKDAKVNIDGDANIKMILAGLLKYNVPCKIIFDARKNKAEINEVLIELGFLSKDGNILKHSNLDIEFSNLSMVEEKKYSFDEYLEYESFLYSIVAPAQSLSPLEKYIYVYDIVKRFKLYNTPNKDNMNADKLDRNSRIKIKHVSRDLYDILENEYMVCVGYANFLRDLLNKLGISNADYSLDVELSAYKAKKQIENNNSNYSNLSSLEKRDLISLQQTYIPMDTYGGHDRVLVYIKDEKYGIDGMYFSDPTWDNEIIDNSYAHCLMTEEDVSLSSKKPRMDIDNLLFSATNIYEFNNMLNVCINLAVKKRIDSNNRYHEYLISTGKSDMLFDDEVDEAEEFCEFFKKFFSKLSSLFSDECHNITMKHPCLNEKNYGIDSIYNLSDDVISMIHDVGSLIVSKQNKTVPRDTLKSVIKEVYSDIYDNGLNDDDIDSFFKYTDDNQIIEFGSARFK